MSFRPISPRGTNVMRARPLIMESENDSTASPIKQLPINQMPADSFWEQKPPQMITATSGVDNSQLATTDADIVPPVNVPLDQPSNVVYMTPTSTPVMRTATRKAVRASQVATPPPAQTVTPVLMPQQTAPGTTPVQIVDSPPSNPAIVPSTTTTATGAPAPATALVPLSGNNAGLPSTQSHNTIDLFGYQIPLSYVLIGGALLAFWLMDTHKEGRGR